MAVVYWLINGLLTYLITHWLIVMMIYSLNHS